MAAGKPKEISVCLNRQVVLMVAEETISRAALNFNEFPYERPRAGQLPGLFALNPTVYNEEL